MTAVVVLGLHCGGTSAVAGVLHHLGVHMGDELLGPGPNNPKGHFEDLEFVRMHDRLIGDWRRPELTTSRFVWEAYEALIEKRCSTHALWGVKDPRMVWVGEAFIRHCSHVTKATVKVVDVDRRPAVAAQSLFSRGGHTPLEALDISYRYYSRKRDLLGWGFSQQSRHPRAVYHRVVYDQLMDHTERTILNLVSWLGFRPDEEGIWDKIDAAMAFVDPRLRHWREA
jgi:hypothetical protein